MVTFWRFLEITFELGKNVLVVGCDPKADFDEKALADGLELLLEYAFTYPNE